MEITRAGDDWEWCWIPAMKAKALAEGFGRGIVDDPRELKVDED
jgi:hypothetical protein